MTVSRDPGACPPEPDLLLGIDLGTTRIKAVVHHLDGREVAAAATPTPWRTVAGGSELDALELREILLGVSGQAGQRAVQATSGRIVAIGATGMGESGVLTGPQGEPLAPIPAWHDQRADVDVVRDALGESEFQSATGMRLDAQPSLPKLLRQRRTIPATAAAREFSSVPEWAVRCLGGPAVSELSLASRTGLFDVVTGQRWDAARDLLGADLLGELVIAGDAVGLAGGDGVPEVLVGAVLTVAGHDHQTAALAMGAAADGTLLDSLGTAEALLRFTSHPLERSVVGRLAAAGITTGRTVLDGHWCVLHGLRTGFVLERVAAALGLSDRDARARIGLDAVAELGTSAVLAELVPEGVRLTLRSGESAAAGPAAVWAATVAAVVAAGSPGVQRVADLIGRHRRVIATGGWLANPAVLAAKRNQFPGLLTATGTEAGAAGAAYLAGVAAGLLPAEPGVPPPPWGPFTPCPAAADPPRNR